MTAKNSSQDGRSAVRFSRVLGLPWAMAIGMSVTIGIGVFVLLGMVLRVASERTNLVYALVPLIYLPTILVFAERGLAYMEGNGAFQFDRARFPSSILFSNSWLSLGGFLGVTTLAAWGVAYHVNRALTSLFAITVNEIYIALGIVILVAWYRSISATSLQRTSMRVIMVVTPTLALVLVAGYFMFEPAPMIAKFAVRGPTNIPEGLALLATMLWGTGLILDRRNQIQRPKRNLLLAMILILGLGGLFGWAASLLADKNALSLAGDMLPLASIAKSSGAVAEMIVLVTAIFLCLFALDFTLVSGRRTLRSMVKDRMINTQLTIPGINFTFKIGSTLIFSTSCLLVIALLSFDQLARVTALLFLFTSVVIIVPGMFPSQFPLPAKRPIKLPFQPLFPALAIAISIYLSLTMPYQTWIKAGVWIILGIIYYLVYARKSFTEARKREQVVAEAIELQKGYRVLVDTTGRSSISSLLRAGEKLAAANDGQLLVVKIITNSEYQPVNRARGFSALQEIKDKIADYDIQSVPADAIIRFAPSHVDGILETVREEDIDLLLVGWSTLRTSGNVYLNPALDEIVQHAQCDVGVLHGRLPELLDEVTVSTAGGPHAAEALKYGEALALSDDGEITALNIIPGAVTPEKKNTAKVNLSRAISKTRSPEHFIQKIAPANDVTAGILGESEEADLLLMGASHRGLLDDAVFAGIPFNVAQSRTKATLLIKHYEGTGQFWVRQIWQMLYKFFPKLTVSERVEVTETIQGDAIAGIDFYMMIVLSSIIAVLGLITDSAAVIIGAMLVAPLMSPILVMAHSIVLGDIPVLAKATESTTKGILAAIVVAAVVAMVLPSTPITAEIIARTRPNILDLMVALASGAAAAYAISRKHLSAALPGVAIAAALVPPLTVVGYGLGYSLYSVAGGAMLLFLTNLSAIIFSGAIIFLLLGFRPTRADRGVYMQRYILVAVLMLLVLAIPLGVASYNLGNQLDRQQNVETVFTRILAAESADVEDLAIQPRGDGYLVTGTVYAYQQLTAGEIADIQAELSASIGAPVTIRVRVIPARLEQINLRGTPVPAETTPIP